MCNTNWRERKRMCALTCVTNCSFYSIPTLEQELHKPWCNVTRSSCHAHHLLFSTHPVCVWERLFLSFVELVLLLVRREFIISTVAGSDFWLMNGISCGACLCSMYWISWKSKRISNGWKNLSNCAFLENFRKIAYLIILHILSYLIFSFIWSVWRVFNIFLIIESFLKSENDTYFYLFLSIFPLNTRFLHCI